MVLPSLKDLNSLSASQNALLLLRVLQTSDLSFFSDLLEPSSRSDIAKVCSDLLEMDGSDAGLSPLEMSEFRSLVDGLSS